MTRVPRAILLPRFIVLAFALFTQGGVFAVPASATTGGARIGRLNHLEDQEDMELL
jgi:hypothetical protein